MTGRHTSHRERERQMVDTQVHRERERQIITDQQIEAEHVLSNQDQSWQSSEIF